MCLFVGEQEIAAEGRAEPAATLLTTLFLCSYLVGIRISLSIHTSICTEISGRQASGIYTNSIGEELIWYSIISELFTVKSTEYECK